MFFVLVEIFLRIGVINLYVFFCLLGMIDGFFKVFFFLLEMLVLIKLIFEFVSFLLCCIVFLKNVLLLLIKMLFLLRCGNNFWIVVFVVGLVLIINII